MKKLLLSLALCLGSSAAWAQSAPCLGVGGINTVPQTGVTCGQEPTIPTFAASTSGFAIASTATDIACLTGSATKVVRVQEVRLSGSAGTQVVIPAILFIRTAPDSAGTAVVMTPFAMDSNNVASTVSNAQYFTANPTINDTSQTMIDVASWGLVKTDGTNGLGNPFTSFDYTARNFSQAPILRGVAQQLCVNVGKTSPSSSLAQVSFRWTENAQ